VHRYRFYQEEYTIAVPWSNKTLKAEWMSFRSKMVPGAQEEWRLKLSGSKGEQVSAEMLATLYDASLDAFLPHRWSLFPYPSFAPQISATVGQALEPVFAESSESEWNRYEPPYAQGYDALFFEDFRSARRRLLAAKGSRRRNKGTFEAATSSGIGFVGSPAPGLGGLGAAPSRAALAQSADESAPSPRRISSESVPQARQASSPKANPQPSPTDFRNVQIRKNLNETAFFFPTLTTNEAGEIVFRFSVPEALTRWRFLGWAHTKDVRIGEISAESITQKDLMIQPNPPRFLRENDELEFPVKITNLSGKDLTGTAQLSLLDASTMQPLGLQSLGEQPFSVKAGGNVALFWRIKVPVGISAIAYRAVAKAGNFSDGEENVLPTLTDKILVTETLPLPVRAKQTKSFELTKLLNASSPTLRHERLTLEFTSNPAWYAVQALPYLMEFPHECAEQTFARYYANSIASFVANSSPKIQRVFEKWKTENPSALLSNLEKNQELKQVLIEETPWVLSGRSESERKRRVALLFELNTLAQSLKQAEQKLVSMQLPSGGFPWFPGMSESRWVTQHIAAGVGHLDKLGIYKRPKNVMLTSALPASLGQAMYRAIEYLDEEMTREYEWILKHSTKPDDDPS
jgi:Large extracellular alpha-helical protein